METILGVIFCGGRAIRLGGMSKMEIDLGGLSLLERAANHLRPHVKAVALSVKPDTSLPENHGLNVIHDMPNDLDNPSVAIALLSALKYARDNGFDAILTLPVDTPFLPSDYASRMIEAIGEMECVCAKHKDRIHGLHSLWKTLAYDKLHQSIINEKSYKISDLYKLPLSTSCSFTHVDKSIFLNINTESDLAQARQYLRDNSA